MRELCAQSAPIPPAPGLGPHGVVKWHVPYHLKNRTVSLELGALESLFSSTPHPTAQLFTPDGRRLQRPWQTILGSVSGYQRLNHDLTVTNDETRRLGLPAAWSRLESDPDRPTFALLHPAGDLGYLLSMFKSELGNSALLACDPEFRVMASTSAAENLLSFAGQGKLVDHSLGELLGLDEMPQDRTRMERELLVPTSRREKVKLQVQLEPHVDFSGRASGWLARLALEPYQVSPVINWQSFIDQYPGIILRLDEQGKVLFSNRLVAGITVKDMQERGVFEFVPEEYRVTALQFRRSLVIERKPISGEIPIRDQVTSELVWFRLSASPILRGEDVEVLVYATDISEQKKAAEELKASRRHIRSLSSKLDRAQEKERRRISRQLHDELGGLLTAVRLELGALERCAELGPEASLRLEGVDTLIQETLATVRRLSTELRPPILDDLGLRAALHSLFEVTGKRCGFRTKLRIEKSIPGDSDLHLQLYRICQEALTNIARHAQANKVDLSLTRPYIGTLHLRIKDDGRGFDLRDAASKGRLGHAGIAERVNLLGGTLELTSRPNEGCRIEISVPLEEG